MKPFEYFKAVNGNDVKYIGLGEVSKYYNEGYSIYPFIGKKDGVDIFLNDKIEISYEDDLGYKVKFNDSAKVVYDENRLCFGLETDSNLKANFNDILLKIKNVL